MKNQHHGRTALVTFFLFTILILPLSQASAFSLDDLSNAADSATDAAQGAAKASDLLTSAQNVYSGFSSMTENMVDAQVSTMSLINPSQEEGLLSEVNGFNSESGFNRIMKLTGFSELMDSELGNLDLTSRLAEIVTDSAGRDKALSIFSKLKNAYSSGESSVENAGTLYNSIRDFLASPSSEGISELAMSKLTDYSDNILPFIIEKGPERLKSISSLINTYSSIL